MRKMKLTRMEREIEEAAGRGEFTPVPKEELDMIVKIIETRKKNAVLNLRINSIDLGLIKQKAAKSGVKYQTFIAEYLHRLAHS